MQVCQTPALVDNEAMLRKLLWSAIYGAIGAAATVAARRVSSRLWRTLTGEEPPTKK